MLELILTTENKVVATNLDVFEQQANQFLSTLTQKFETDDDFAKAKDEVKILKETEDKIKLAIDGVLNGSKDVTALIETTKGIAERFREERLTREKRVKERETEIKQDIVNAAYQRILTVKSGFEMEVSLALERNLPKVKVKERLEKATARLSARRKLIPITYDYLFKDWLDLISGEQELEPIIQSRIEAEQQREAEVKAKAEQEAQAKAKAEKVQAEATAIANEMEAQAVRNEQTMWEELRPQVTITIPAPLDTVQEGQEVFYLNGYDSICPVSSFKFQEEGRSGFELYKNGLLFGTKEDAQAFLDALKEARR